jgi:hypothetical protein
MAGAGEWAKGPGVRRPTTGLQRSQMAGLYLCTVDSSLHRDQVSTVWGQLHSEEFSAPRINSGDRLRSSSISTWLATRPILGNASRR